MFHVISRENYKGSQGALITTSPGDRDRMKSEMGLGVGLGTLNILKNFKGSGRISKICVIIEDVEGYLSSLFQRL